MENVRIAVTNAANMDLDQDLADFDLQHGDILNLESLIGTGKDSSFERFRKGLSFADDCSDRARCVRCSSLPLRVEVFRQLEDFCRAVEVLSIIFFIFRPSPQVIVL